MHSYFSNLIEVRNERKQGGSSVYSQFAPTSAFHDATNKQPPSFQEGNEGKLATFI